MSPPNKIAEPFGFTLFCDDIRDEVGGKETFVGVYNGVLYLSVSFPTVLPKLCLSITYHEPYGAHPDHAELLIYLPSDPDDKPSMRGNIDYATATATNNVQDLAPSGGPELTTVKTRVVLSPLVINDEGDIRVRVNRGDRIIKLGRLLIRKSPEIKPSVV